MKYIDFDLQTSYEKLIQNYMIPLSYIEKYTVTDCFKDHESKKIFLISNKKTSQKYIFKFALNQHRQGLKQEYDFYSNIPDVLSDIAPDIYDYNEDNDRSYLLREYIDGPSLVDYYEKRMFLSTDEALRITSSIADTISKLHHVNPPIIHRDIKPENFVFDRTTGRWMLVDFDTIRQFNPSKSRDTTLLGTPGQAAPEQFGFSQSDVRTDIYALGKTMLYLFTGTTDEKILGKASIPAKCKSIIKKSISFDPGERYETIDEFIKQLRKIKIDSEFKKTPGKNILIVSMLCVTLAVGFFAGKFSNKTFTNKSIKTNTTASSMSDPHSKDVNTSDVSSSITASSDDSYHPITPAENSLMAQAGYIPFEPQLYEGLTNAIIMDYLTNDKEALVSDCEIVLQTLYSDKSFEQISGTDYAGYDRFPPETDRLSERQTMKNYMVYRNNLLEQYQSNLAPLGEAIYSQLDFYMTLDHSCFHLYTIGSTDPNGYPVSHTSALMDIIRCIALSIDFQDGIKVHPL